MKITFTYTLNISDAEKDRLVAQWIYYRRSKNLKPSDYPFSKYIIDALNYDGIDNFIYEYDANYNLTNLKID